MNKRIGRKTYDTEKAQLITRKASGCYGDPAGFEEKLFRRNDQAFFLCGVGGSASCYPEADIVPLTLEQARSWLTDVLGSESAQQICEPMEKAAAEPAAKPAARTVRKIRSEAVV